jgi:DNA-binding CsgD family transcriptional regulator
MPPVQLPREDRKPLLVYPMKLSSVTANVFAECQALLVIVDLEKRNGPPETTLQTVFHLSTAEARLACRLASGEPIDTIADELRISKATARNHLKNIFAKTGVHRQAEFVALVGSLLGPVIGG